MLLLMSYSIQTAHSGESIKFTIRFRKKKSNIHLFLGRIVVVVRVEGPIRMIEREVFVFLPVDFSAATRCLKMMCKQS